VKQKHREITRVQAGGRRQKERKKERKKEKKKKKEKDR
jgi:hypothetical protein